MSVAWPLVVAPGSNPLQYIKEALEEELFTAGAYDINADTVIKGRVDRLDFDSFGTGHWDIALTVSSKHLPEGYRVSIRNVFKTSFTAIGACKNAARAYGPAVQSLLNGVVTNPKFPQLVGASN